MDKRRLILILQSVLCIALAALLCTLIIGMYAGGVIAQQSNPDALIFTREAIAARLLPALVIFVLITAIGIWARFAGVRAEDKAPQKGLIGRIQNRGESDGDAIIRRLLLAAAFALIIAGIFSGGMQDVINKAIHICTECIGLG